MSYARFIKSCRTPLIQFEVLSTYIACTRPNDPKTTYFMVAKKGHYYEWGMRDREVVFGSMEIPKLFAGGSQFERFIANLPGHSDETMRKRIVRWGEFVKMAKLDQIINKQQ